MKTKRFRKLSAAVTGASLETASSRAAQLWQLLATADEVAGQLAVLSDKLKKVAAEPGQPFVFMRRLETNQALLASLFHDCDDVVYRRLTIAGCQWLIIYIDGLIDTELLQRGVVSPLQAASVCFSGNIELAEALS